MGDKMRPKTNQHNGSQRSRGVGTMRTRIIVVLGIIVSFIFMGLAPPAFAADKTWNVASGDWSSGTNWTGGEPGSGDDALVNNNGTVTISLSGEVANNLYLGQNTSTSGLVNMTAGTLTVSLALVPFLHR